MELKGKLWAPCCVNILSYKDSSASLSFGWFMEEEARRGDPLESWTLLTSHRLQGFSVLPASSAVQLSSLNFKDCSWWRTRQYMIFNWTVKSNIFFHCGCDRLSAKLLNCYFDWLAALLLSYCDFHSYSWELHSFPVGIPSCFRSFLVPRKPFLALRRFLCTKLLKHSPAWQVKR